jgi:hypothetical protein
VTGEGEGGGHGNVPEARLTVPCRDEEEADGGGCHSCSPTAKARRERDGLAYGQGTAH